MHVFHPCRVSKCHPYEGYILVRIGSLGYHNNLGEHAVLPNQAILGKILYLATIKQLMKLALFGRVIKN